MSFKHDTRVPNAGLFTFEREDHTVGNLLRTQLLLSPNIIFAGYRVPHPLEPKIELKVQTTEDTNPIAAVESALTELKNEFSTIQKAFNDEKNRTKWKTAATMGGLGVHGNMPRSYAH